MPWLQLKIQTSRTHVETINQFLNLFDAVAITLQDAADQPLLEPDLGTTPLWDAVWIVSLFPNTIDGKKIIEFIQQQLPPGSILNYQIEQITDQNWERAWLDNFKPMHFGHSLWVCPSVIDPPDPNAVNIILDPGLAFGTGTHPTTALCLEWLAENPPLDKVVIDYGCGSGILAIAALKLGAKKVYAVDHDEQALEATLENAKRNQINLKHLDICFPQQLPSIKADIILANILAKPLMELAPTFSNLLKKNGKIILSGILNDQVDEVKNSYHQYFKIDSVIEKENWARITASAL